MKNYLHHLHTLLIHKFYVFVAGNILGCSFRRLVLHDILDVFRYSSSEFADARKKCNWRYYVYLTDKYHLKGIEIPEVYVYEMVADWMASLKEAGHRFAEIADWYDTNKKFMIIHPATDKLILAMIDINGYFISENKDLDDLLKQAPNETDSELPSECKLVDIDITMTNSEIYTSDKLAGYCFWCNSYHPKEQPCLRKRNNW